MYSQNVNKDLARTFRFGHFPPWPQHVPRRKGAWPCARGTGEALKAGTWEGSCPEKGAARDPLPDPEKGVGK